jgi:hypothetical protein
VAREIFGKYGAVAGKPPAAGGLVGRWQYPANGKTCVREFRADGSLHLYLNGVEHASWKGFTWTEKDGEVSCRKADGTVFGKHRLTDPQTLMFIGEPYGPAIREIQHRE